MYILELFQQQENEYFLGGGGPLGDFCLKIFKHLLHTS